MVADWRETFTSPDSVIHIQKNLCARVLGIWLQFLSGSKWEILLSLLG
jgi:hypothetical protein